MKKSFVFALLVVVTLSGCHYSTNTTVIGSTQKVVNVAVAAQGWKYTQLSDTTPFANNYFYATVDIPEITATVFDKGEVHAYAVYDRNSNNYARQYLLPFVTPKEEQLQNDDWIYYTEIYDFTYGIGWGEFNYRASDFAYEDDTKINPPAMDFRIVITTPNK